EVAPDFRGVQDLRKLFELGAAVIAPGGLLVFNVHLAAQGYTPERSAREFSQQCYSALFSGSELIEAVSGLPFELVGNDSVHDYEREHLPEGGWPPTPWYENWTLGLDVYDLSRAESPVELRWLVFRRCPGDASSTALDNRSLYEMSGDTRRRRFDP